MDRDATVKALLEQRALYLRTAPHRVKTIDATLIELGAAVPDEQPAKPAKKAKGDV